MMSLLRHSGERLNWRTLLDFVYPPSCPACGRTTASQRSSGGVCYDCWEHLDFCGDYVCIRCGEPMEVLSDGSYGASARANDSANDIANDIDSICGDCMVSPPLFDGARSVFFYNDVIKSLVMRFKHGDRMELRALLGRLLLDRVEDWVAEVDYIVPVPLHYWRVVERRYNQAILLARTVCEVSGFEDKLVYDMLVRDRYTLAMKHMTVRRRYENLRRAIGVHRSWRDSIRGKSVLVIDDVHTGGATFSACAHALRRFGVSRIYVASVARVLLG